MDTLQADLRLISDGLSAWATLFLPRSLDISSVSRAIQKSEAKICSGMIVNGRDTLARIEQQLLVTELSHAGQEFKARVETFQQDLVEWRDEAEAEYSYNSVPDPISFGRERSMYDIFSQDIIDREGELQNRAFGIAEFAKLICEKYSPRPSSTATPAVTATEPVIEPESVVEHQSAEKNTSESKGEADASPAVQDAELSRKQLGLQLWNDGSSWAEVAEALGDDKKAAGAVGAEIRRYAKDNRLEIRTSVPGRKPKN